MATRVTPRAGSASLRWHESRHGQPSVIADVRQKMNRYSLAGLKVYGGLFFLFFFFPAMILSLTQRFENGFTIALWAFGVFLGACCFSMVYGIIHFRIGRATAGWAIGQSIVTLIGAVCAASLPALWAPQAKDIISIAAWIAVYGFAPTLFAALFYLASIRHKTINEK